MQPDGAGSSAEKGGPGAWEGGSALGNRADRTSPEVPHLGSSTKERRLAAFPGAPPCPHSPTTISPCLGTWRPRRSIVFASWGAEEFGLIGSTEFTEVREPLSLGQGRGVGLDKDVGIRADGTPGPRRPSTGCRSVLWPTSTWTSRCSVGNEAGEGCSGSSGGDPSANSCALRSQRHPESPGDAPGAKCHLLSSPAGGTRDQGRSHGVGVASGWGVAAMGVVSQSAVPPEAGPDGGVAGAGTCEWTGWKWAVAQQ